MKSHPFKVGDTIRAGWSLTGTITKFTTHRGGAVAVYWPWGERYTRQAPVDGLELIPTCEFTPGCQGKPHAPNRRHVWLCRACWDSLPKRG